MNHVVRSATAAGPHAAPLATTTTRAAAFFHSTPISERKRTHWNSGRGSFSSKKFNYYARRARKFESKRTLLCNLSDYAEYLFQSCRDKAQSNYSINDDTSWFRRQLGSKGTRKNGFGLHEPQWGSCRTKRNGSFEFCTSVDDDEVETMFRSAFGGERFHDYYWSFHTENFHSGHANHKSSRNWRYQTDDETDTSSESDLTSERLALGLRASGSLKLEEVKNAYRACALRWHPDRHQGSSKVAAEERFKHCSAAYKVLCDKLAIA